jgi:hypothetical protein
MSVYREPIPGFPARGPTRFACAAFRKESRIKFANASEPDRKFRGIAASAVE